MSVLISAHQISKSYSTRPLFSGLTFAIESGEKIGLIGPNGAGKSTLLKILASQIYADEGSVSFQRGLKVGILEQVPQFQPQATVLSAVLEYFPDALQSGDWEKVMKAQEWISKLSLDFFGEDALVSLLSGGWKKRVALARELLKTPDVLLLDEPTNHLDVESILWLEEFIRSVPMAVVTITHDRLFLQRIADRIIEINPRHEGGLLSVRGDYATFLESREQLLAGQESREIALKNTLRRETEWLRRGAKARTTKQQARIQRASDLADEVQDLSERNLTRQVSMDFQNNTRSPKKLIDAQGISKSYGEKNIFWNLDLLLTPGTRLGLLGHNGSGKSTLIRVLLGMESPDSGTIQRSDQLSVAYFDQTRDALDPDVTVLKTLCPSGEWVDYRGTKLHIRGYLDRFLFSSGQADLPVGRLSGGEQSRLLIARLMLRPANLLVLDEPTNDLDMTTLQVLEDCLVDFGGAIILVTHDRYFLDQVATQILAFPSETAQNLSSGKTQLTRFSDLSQWENWRLQQRAQNASSKKGKSPSPSVLETPSPSASASPKKRKLSFKEQRELDQMEDTIHQAEAKLAKISEEIASSENISKGEALSRLTAEMALAQKEVDQLYHRWAELTGDACSE